MVIFYNIFAYNLYIKMRTKFRPGKCEKGKSYVYITLFDNYLPKAEVTTAKLNIQPMGVILLTHWQYFSQFLGNSLHEK